METTTAQARDKANELLSLIDGLILARLDWQDAYRSSKSSAMARENVEEVQDQLREVLASLFDDVERKEN